MPYDIGEKYKVVEAALRGTANALSETYSLQDVNRVSVFAGINILANTPTSSGGMTLSTVINPATVSVVVGGDVAATAMTLLTGATVVMGQATIGEFTGWDVVQIGGASACSSGSKITVDGVDFTLDSGVAATARVPNKKVSASASTQTIKDLSTNINYWCPHLKTFDVTTSGANARLSIKRKHPGPAFNVSVTANAVSSRGISVMGLKQVGAVEFTAANVVATNSSYSHFAVKIDTGSTRDQRIGAIAVMETGHNQVVSRRKKV